MVKHRVVTRTLETRANKAGANSRQRVYRLADVAELDRLDETLRVWQAELEAKGAWPK
jgi:hypothetical protein